MDMNVKLTDHSGRTYRYGIFLLESAWPESPGNFIFARRGIDGWTPLYVGQTDNFNRRITAGHEAWPWCRSRGAGFVLARVNADAAARLVEEDALILAYDPPANRPEVSLRLVTRRVPR
jgi:hypothetical protein